MKQLVEKSAWKFTCLGENTKQYIIFLVLTEKKNLQELIKEKTNNLSFRYYDLLIATDLWQSLYQILLM